MLKSHALNDVLVMHKSHVQHVSVHITIPWPILLQVYIYLPNQYVPMTKARSKP